MQLINLITEFGFIWFCDFCIWDICSLTTNLLWQDAGEGNIWRFLPILTEKQKHQLLREASFSLTLFRAAATRSGSKCLSMQNHLHQRFNLEKTRVSFDHLQKLELQNKRHGSPCVTWWRWRTWMMRCGGSFCFPSTQNRRLEVASWFVINPRSKRSIQTKETGIVDTPNVFAYICSLIYLVDVANCGKRWFRYETPIDIPVAPVSASIARMLLHASWVPASIHCTTETFENSAVKPFVQSRCGCNCVNDWDLEIELLGCQENEIKIDQVIRSVLIAKRAGGNWTVDIDIYCSSIRCFCENPSKLKLPIRYPCLLL